MALVADHWAGCRKSDSDKATDYRKRMGKMRAKARRRPAAEPVRQYTPAEIALINALRAS